MTAPNVTYNFTASGETRSDETDQNFADLVNYIAARDAGTTAWGAVLTPYVDFVGQSSAPTTVAGRVYFNSTDLQFYGCKDGSTWSILG